MQCTRPATELLQHYFLLCQRKVVLLFCAARNENVARRSSLLMQRFQFQPLPITNSLPAGEMLSVHPHQTLRCLVDVEKKIHYRKRALRFNQITSDSFG
jgi:hypothetical protein